MRAIQFLQKEKNQWIVLAACFVVLVLLVKPWQLYFLNDDFLHVPASSWLMRGGFMRPLANMLLALDKAMYGKNAVGFFCTGLLIHSLCVMAVYGLTKSIAHTYVPDFANPLLPFITALLFLFYPFHAESLMWVLGRGSMLSTLLALWSLFFYIKTLRSTRYIIFSWLCFTLALLVYENIWNLILLYGLLSIAAVAVKCTSFKKAWGIFSCMLMTFIAYLLWRLYLLGTIAGDGYDEVNENLSRFVFLTANLIKLVGRNYIPPGKQAAFFLLSLFFVTGFFIWCIYLFFKKNRQLGLLILGLWIGLVTAVITFTPLGIDTHYNEADRYLYYSSFFFCLFIGFIITGLFKKNVQLILTVLVCTVFGTVLASLQFNYRFASAITRATTNITNQYPDYRRAFFIDVPKKYGGTPILRVGLKQAIDWTCENCLYDTVIVLSQVEQPDAALPYKNGVVSFKELAAEKEWSTDMPSIIDSTGKKELLQKTDVIFWYKNNGLYKVVIP